MFLIRLTLLVTQLCSDWIATGHDTSENFREAQNPGDFDHFHKRRSSREGLGSGLFLNLVIGFKAF